MNLQTMLSIWHPAVQPESKGMRFQQQCETGDDVPRKKSPTYRVLGVWDQISLKLLNAIHGCVNAFAEFFQLPILLYNIAFRSLKPLPKILQTQRRRSNG